MATGYNGSITGSKHCNKCMREGVPSGERIDLCRGAHAEQNIISQAAQYGIPLKDSTIYCTNKPCSICFKLLGNTLIKEIIFREDYKDPIIDQLIFESKYQQGCFSIDNIRYHIIYKF